MTSVDIRAATHVKVGGKIERIVSKWGVFEDGYLAKPSQGGFGVVLEDGRHIGMFEAEAYFRDEPAQ